MVDERERERRLRRLREAGPEELHELVDDLGDELSVAEARQVLRNVFVRQETIALLLERRSLLGAHELRRDLASHPRTPEMAALRFLPGLPWRDVANIGRDVKIHPRVRRSADLQLAQRLPGLTLGERISLARFAGPGVLEKLRHDKEPRVVRALLENPRVTEGLLLPMLTRESTPPEVLRIIADSPRWRTSYGIRAALCRNPRAPEARVIGWLGLLRRDDLQAVARNHRLSPGVRARARELLLGTSR
jgi:hypothetical protein